MESPIKLWPERMSSDPGETERGHTREDPISRIIDDPAASIEQISSSARADGAGFPSPPFRLGVGFIFKRPAKTSRQPDWSRGLGYHRPPRATSGSPNVFQALAPVRDVCWSSCLAAVSSLGSLIVLFVTSSGSAVEADSARLCQ
ncbi:hypothetical protein RRG08_004770 [Elysia crispata]|uniref:Uncharacterized protein n=1 Tax=Elysia crispata TaxID=231223 RepID=A0AAE1DZX3_9GAST|nr:hypothetical protein RRG08_004770 [Elysia crispata]